MEIFINIVLFVLFIGVFFLMQKLLNKYSIKKSLIICILSFVATIVFFMIAFLCGMLLSMILNIPQQIIGSYCIKINMALDVVILTNVMIKISTGTVNGMAGFHKKYNASNIEKQPLKYVIQNNKSIANIYKYGITGLFCMMLFIICFIMK